MAIGAGFYTYLQYVSRIKIVNDNKYFKVTFYQTKPFTDLLDSWGVWEKNNIKSEYDTALYTIKNIQIVFTDDLNSVSYIKDSSNSPAPLSKSLTRVSKNQTLTVRIYLNPNLRSLNDVNKNDLILRSVLERLYTSTHSLANQDTKNKDIGRAFVEIRKDRIKEPFVVNIR